jgi:selenium metabolism protein YedF
MVKKVDARGQACPKPVIMTKNVLDDGESDKLVTIVDNEVAKENVIKLVKSLKYSYEVEKRGNNEFYIHISKGENERESKEITCPVNTFKDITIVFGSNTLGKGSEELGKILVKGYIYTLTEAEPYPATLIFLNSGVKLTTEGSEVIDDLKKLENEGVEILSCGTCLDYYNIKDELMVGQVSNMYTILEKMKNATNTIVL